MAGTKTGVGGFEIDGKIHDFDVGDPSAPGLDPTNPDTGDIHVDNTTKDISKRTKTTLSQYLKGLTAKNAYPIDGKYNEAKVTDNNGVPHPLSDDPLNSPQYSKRPADSGVVADSPDLRQSTGTIPDPAASLSDLTKGKKSPEKVDGNHLLPGVKKNNQGSVVGGYTTSILNNNRFTDASRSVTTDLDHPAADYNPVLSIPGRGDVDMLRLAQVGNALSLRASQELTSGDSNFNPTGTGATAAAILPSLNQLGVLKVSNVLLEANDVLNGLAADEVPGDALGEIASFGGQSWGNLNNVDEPFQGLLNLGQIALSLALTAAVLLLFEGLGLLLSMGSGPTIAPKKASFDHIYKLGSSTFDPNGSPSPVSILPNLMVLLGLHGTLYPFGDALSTGAAAFFLGADHAKDGLLGQIAGAVTSAVGGALSDSTAAGFNIIVARTIVRSGLAIATAISDIGKAFASNPISGIEGVLGLLGVLRASKIIAAINVFTILGDAILSEDPKEGVPGVTGERLRMSRIDALPNEGHLTTVEKNRLVNPATGYRGTKLAWSSNRAPAMYLIPDSVLTMQLIDNKLGAFRGPLGLTDTLSKTMMVAQSAADQTKGARIPRDSSDITKPTVKAIESMLDAEYVPFYFHDLRTNEIISFHAFLTSLTDDYTASWETTEGYGRVDPIKIYKSTARRIALSFYVAATSKTDFDDMWMKINKLVTLVYPQYTQGRVLTDGVNSTFIQPFSQLIGASPLIRIRLGDLLRSNYSRFAMARLFGADTGLMQLDGSAITFSGAAANIDQLKQKVLELITSPQTGKTYSLHEAGWDAVAPGASLPIPIPMVGPSNPTQAARMNVDKGDLPYLEFAIASIVDGGSVSVTCAIASDLTDRGMSSTQVADITAKLNVKYGSGAAPAKVVIGGKFVVPITHLVPTIKTFNDAVTASGITGVDNIDKLADFLDESKNALIKSFKSVRGKGLAGVIETMNFDWYDKVTWETVDGSVAPKLCKVTLSFSPIHDISPGIDYQGYNRAPIYPVGAAMGNSIDIETAES